MRNSPFKFIKESIADFVFGKSCIVCNEALELGSYFSLCTGCIKKINDLRYVKSIESTGECDLILSALEYKDFLRDKMLKFKFEENRYLCSAFSLLVEKLWERIYENYKNKDIVAVSTPIHIWRGRLYNQADLIAKEFCKNCNIEYRDDVLVKTRAVKPISKTGIKEKRSFVENSFMIINDVFINNRTVLLIDDIYTTGETANECARLLKNHGAKEVILLTPCYTPKK